MPAQWVDMDLGNPFGGLADAFSGRTALQASRIAQQNLLDAEQRRVLETQAAERDRYNKAYEATLMGNPLPFPVQKDAAGMDIPLTPEQERANVNHRQKIELDLSRTRV